MVLRDRNNIGGPCLLEHIDKLICIKILCLPQIDEVIVRGIAVDFTVMLGSRTVGKAHRVEVPFGVWVVLVPVKSRIRTELVAREEMDDLQNVFWDCA